MRKSFLGREVDKGVSTPVMGLEREEKVEEKVEDEDEEGGEVWVWSGGGYAMSSE